MFLLSLCFFLLSLRCTTHLIPKEKTKLRRFQNKEPEKNTSILHTIKKKKIIKHKVYKWHQVSSEYNNNKWKKADCECKYTNSIKDADFVFAHPHKTKIHKYRKNQLWISQFWESEKIYPSQNTESFDYSISYRDDADFPNYAMIVDTFDKNNLLDIVPYEIKLKEEMVSVWISNCNGKGRNKILSNLKKENITIAQYGRCNRNHYDTAKLNYASEKLKEWDKSKHRGVQKMVHSSQHLFLFAAENSISPYYHTEKIYHGLMSGTVPIYFGAETIDKYVPEHSIIKVSDHENIAAYLKKVASDVSLYNSYLEWRNKPLPSYFLNKLNYKPKSVCEICNKLIASSP